jgi:hypothetical protein
VRVIFEHTVWDLALAEKQIWKLENEATNLEKKTNIDLKAGSLVLW